MVHLPSFLVGSLTAGVLFLGIHKELSHRQRLSWKWVLQEKAEKQFRKLASQVRSSRSLQPQPNQDSFISTKSVPSQVTQTWNQGISFLQKACRKD
ncbi:hypothetical protein ACA910_016833 [Epithemia clementina (nom. ined.)]